MCDLRHLNVDCANIMPDYIARPTRFRRIPVGNQISR